MYLRDSHPFIENTPSLTSRSNERGDILTYMLVTCPSWRWSTLDWDWSVRLKGRSRSKRALATISGPIVFDETPMQAMQSITHINVRIHLWKIRDGWELGICIIISWVAFLSWVELLFVEYDVYYHETATISDCFIHVNWRYLLLIEERKFSQNVDLSALLEILLESIYQRFIRDLQFVDWLFMQGGLKSSMVYLI